MSGKKLEKPAISRGRGRPRLDPAGLANVEQIRLPLPAGSKDRIRAALDDGESITAFLRAAIDQEIRRRGGYPLASVGKEVGNVDYTVFMATDTYIKQNPTIIQNWTNAIFRGLKWVAAASIADIVKVQQQFFPGLDPKILAAATERYRNLKIWKETPLVEEKPIEIWQDMMIDAGLLETSKRVKYRDVVVTDFANKAKAS